MSDAEKVPAVPEYNVTELGVSKADGIGTVQGNAFVPEDAFKSFYLTSRDTRAHIIEPPYNVTHLYRKTQENNALGPCIEAMVTNVDGTGYVFENDDTEAADTEDDQAIQGLYEFFSQPYPGESFVSIRKRVRRDVESMGYGAMEVIRSAAGEIVFLRYVDAKSLRMVALDEPVKATRTLTRSGREVSIKMMVRERRYAQVLTNNKVVYFKELGAVRDVDKDTGLWSEGNKKLPYEQRGSEVLFFGAIPDAHTPYSVPRWISQLPSVLGSRNAEELNLSFFESGGLPPLLVILQGGALTEQARQQLEKILNGQAKTKLRGAVLEAISTSGSIDSGGNVRVSVERFGSERQSDAMFEKYDARCEERVRRGFRLPPLFVGMAGDYSFATAFASYTVAEAQVFKPEREDFDETISTRLLPEMGYVGYRMRSLPLQVHDAALKMRGIELSSKAGAITLGDMVAAINEATNLELKVMEDRADVVAGGAPAVAPPEQGPEEGGGNGTPVDAPEVTKSDVSAVAVTLAQQAMLAMRKRDVTAMEDVAVQITRLSKADYEHYRRAVALEMFLDDSYDPAGLGELAAYTLRSFGEGGAAS